MMTTPTIPEPQWGAATTAMLNAESILLVTHLKPDGDAIGSLLGLAHALRERGKTVDAAVDGGVPTSFTFIPGVNTVKSELKSGDWGVMISLDASDEERTGDVGAFGRLHSKTVINIDHHPTNTVFGDIHVILPQVASTAEVLLQWFEHMETALSEPVAVALLTGVITDTRGFRTSNVTPDTLSAAQKLMQAGASLTEITARTLESMPYKTLELWKQVLPSVELKHKVISAVVTSADLKAVRLKDPSDAGDLIGLLNSVDQAMIAAVFKQQLDGQISLSLRAKPGYDVAAVALELGGGGHKLAAGATLRGESIEAVKERVLPMLHAAVKAGKLNIA